jgi:hypothetical protein
MKTTRRDNPCGYPKIEKDPMNYLSKFGFYKLFYENGGGSVKFF